MRIGAGRFKGRPLPRARTARPISGRVRTSLFSVLAERLVGAHVLDLCAGVGAMGLEALSRGAAHVTLLDVDGGAVRALSAWLDHVGVSDEATALRRDVLGPPLPDGPFDLVLVDPPFPFWQGDDGVKLLRRALAVLTPAGLLAVKLPARHELPPDAAWTVERRTRVGSVAYALLRHPDATRQGQDKTPIQSPR